MQVWKTTRKTVNLSTVKKFKTKLKKTRQIVNSQKNCFIISLPEPFVRADGPIHAEDSPWCFVFINFFSFGISCWIWRARSRHVWHSWRRPRRGRSHFQFILFASLFSSNFLFFCHFLFVILLSVSVEAKAKEKQQMFRYLVQFCLLLSHLFWHTVLLSLSTRGALFEKRNKLSHLNFAPGKPHSQL